MQSPDLKARIEEFLLKRDEPVPGGDLAVRFATEADSSLEMFDEAMHELEAEGAVVVESADDGVLYRHPDGDERLTESVRSEEGYRRLIREYLAARPGWHDGSELARDVGALADVHFGSSEDPLYPEGSRGDLEAFITAVGSLVANGVVEEQEVQTDGSSEAKYRYVGEER